MGPFLFLLRSFTQEVALWHRSLVGFEGGASRFGHFLKSFLLLFDQTTLRDLIERMDVGIPNATLQYRLLLGQAVNDFYSWN